VSTPAQTTEMQPGGPLRAPLYPTHRPYPLLAGKVSAGRRGFPTEADWQRAFLAGTFLADGYPEPEEKRTSFRMSAGQDTLFIAIDCATPEGAGKGTESVQLYLTQSDRAAFPYVVIDVAADGRLSTGIVARPYTWWASAPIDPAPLDAVRHQVASGERGWRALLSLALSALGIPESNFFFNIVRRSADGLTSAYNDLFGGPPSQVEAFGQAVSVDDAAPWANGLLLPAEVAVGLNRLRLERPAPAPGASKSSGSGARRQAGATVEGRAPGLTLKVAGRCLSPNDAGEFVLPIFDRGPLDLALLSADGETIATYHADVPHPLFVSAREAFLSAEAKECDLDLTLNLAGEPEGPKAAQSSETPDTHPVTVTLCRGSGKAETHRLSLAPGEHSVRLPVPPGEGKEVAVEAKVDLPCGSESAPPSAGAITTMTARHWFAVGVKPEELDVYRPGIRDLSTDRMYWAVIADAVPLRRLRQSGVGALGRAGREQQALWDQSFVYPLALLFKTKHPDNPFFGDRELLASAVLGMEYALRPSESKAECLHPDNRSLQAFLLTYELLQDDVEPARREYWAYELKHRVEATVRRWLAPLSHTCALYSADCGTGTNHMAYYIANVSLAGELFGCEEWKELGRSFMRRLARHGPEGYFPERQGVPVNHYTWLSANALGEYYWRTADPEVEPTLRACARYLTAITTPQGQTMSLHDSRVSGHYPFWFGDFVLSLTPKGRRAARARLLGIMGERPSRMPLELLWRCAENAALFRPGPEEGFTGDDEHAFAHGVIVRRQGFHYGLSTVCLGPVNARFRLDPQNVVELFHREAGCILHAGNSMLQPEAGSFFRRLSEAELAKEPTAPRVDYLPVTGSLARLPDGHDLTLAYWSFQARLAVHVLSPTEARLVATVQHVAGEGPVTFNFFPGVRASTDSARPEPADGRKEEDLKVDGQTLHFGRVTLRAGGMFHVERPFRIMNPYQLEFTYTHKPVRCWVELRQGETFTLDISVADKTTPSP